MTTRTLSREEWPRLADTDLAVLLPYAAPEDTEIVVVEQDERIVGCLAVMRVIHVEGVWIAPEHRGRVSVMRRLLAGMYASAQRFAPTWAMAGAAGPEMHALLTAHLGAVPVPMQTYILPLCEERVCPRLS